VTGFIAALLALVLGLVTLLHAYWGLGGLWPRTSEADLIAKAIGDGRRHMPGRALTLAVAALIGIAALWPLLLIAGPAAPLLRAFVIGVACVLAGVFLARGGAGYLPAWRRLHPVEPFARLDRLIYSPLCLALGMGFAFLVLEQLA
jgi:Protein of unknown function (DUF3995)